MHEYSLTKRLVNIVIDAARRNNAESVSAVHAVAGEDAGIIPGSIQMYYDIIARGTLAEGAKLTVRTLPAMMRCPACALTFPRPRFSFACPACGTLGNPEGDGAAFYVESVELVTRDEPENEHGKEGTGHE